MKLSKDQTLWVAERRGPGVYIRKGRAGTTPVATAKAFKSESLAVEFLDAEVRERLAEGYVVVDAEAALDGPFTVDGTTREPAPIPVNDAIDGAFDELNRRGIVAVQNAGVRIGPTLDDGLTAAMLEANRRRKRGEVPRGLCFYCFQDLERGVRGEGLQLTFRSVVNLLGQRDPVPSIEIGALVRDVLASHGVDATWDGSPEHPIVIAPFPWFRR